MDPERAPATVVAMTSFDACLDLTVRVVPGGTPPKVAVERVRSAVQALPGAAWISVEWCGDAPGESRWLRVFPEGEGAEQWDGTWADLRERITATVRHALDGGAAP